MHGESAGGDGLERRADLLHVLNAIVASDDGPSGFDGKVCVGVLDETGGTFWEGAFGARSSAGFVEEVSDDADALLLLGATDAEVVLDEGRFPEDPVLARIEGDRRILQRFMNRYVQRTSMVSMRASQPSKPTRRRKRR